LGERLVDSSKNPAMLLRNARGHIERKKKLGGGENCRSSQHTTGFWNGGGNLGE